MRLTWLVVFIVFSLCGVGYVVKSAPLNQNITVALQLEAKFYRSINKAVVYPDPLLTLQPNIPTSIHATYVQRLVKSVIALENRGSPLSAKRRLRIAKAALAAQLKTGVDATFMVALARTESDFRPLVLLNTACKRKNYRGYCYADCGITQHHVRGSKRYVVAQCKKLARKYTLSFIKSAKEIAHHIKWCKKYQHVKWHHPLRRCILNRYNQGPFYRTLAKCNRRHKCWAIKHEATEEVERYKSRLARCKRNRRRCRSHAVYWKKHTCFEYGARNQLKAKRSCRYCYDLSKVSTYFYPIKRTTVALTTF